MTLRKALENYQAERRRISGGPYPHPACSCGFCDLVRAADLLYREVRIDEATRRWRLPFDRLRSVAIVKGLWGSLGS